MTAGLSYFRSDTVPSPTSNGGVVTGEVGVNIDVAGGDTRIGIFQPSGAWEYLAELDGAAFTGDITTSGNVALGSDEDDLITVNAPVLFEVFREDFDAPTLVSVDITNGDFVVSATDTEANMLMFEFLNIWYRLEAPGGPGFAGTFTPATFLNNKVLNLDDATFAIDVVDNEAADFVVGGAPKEAFVFDTDSAETAYCEASFTITTIANVSASDFYFGFAAEGAINDAFAFDAATSRAVFVITDTSGDIDITTELAAGGTLSDDAGTDWTNGATVVLRVAVSAADVDFFLNGAQVTQVNAILDPAANTMLVCRFGVRSAGTAKAGIALNYIEVGRAQ